MQFVISNRLRDGSTWTSERDPNGITYYIASGTSWSPVPSSAFLDAVHSTGKHPLLFVHGFNNSFDAALRKAELIEKGLPGSTLVLFSWNSDGEVYDYLADRTHAIASTSDLLRALLLLDGADVIAHSMGSLVLDQALKQYAKTGISNHLIRSLALVASDVIDVVLRNPVYASDVSHGEVFYCETDGALLGSTDLHLFPRLGLTGPIGAPPNFIHKNCTFELLTPLSPVAKHSAYFVKDWFYDEMKKLLEKG